MSQQPTRRAFVSAVVALATGSTIAAVPHHLRAQQTMRPRRIGVLLALFSSDSKEAQAFRQGLRDAGYAEGRDVVIEWRSMMGNYALAPALAADLVQRKVEVIVVESTPAAKAAKNATSTIPIVLAVVADPVESGLVDNLARPGGNITGLSSMGAEFSAKRLQLLKETIPLLTRVAILRNPSNPWHAKVVEDLKAVGPSMSVELSVMSVRTVEDIAPALSAAKRARAQALYVIGNGVLLTHRATLVKLTAKEKLASIYFTRQFPEAGGLMSYGPKLGEVWYRSAGYVDRILMGAKPGDLPMEQPTQFELVVNRKIAKEIGITIPESILVRADEVVQ